MIHSGNCNYYVMLMPISICMVVIKSHPNTSSLDRRAHKEDPIYVIGNFDTIRILFYICTIFYFDNIYVIRYFFVEYSKTKKLTYKRKKKILRALKLTCTPIIGLHRYITERTE